MTNEEHQQLLEMVESGQLDEALQNLDALPDDVRNSADVLITRASILNQQAAYDEALTVLGQVVADDPGHPVALLMMAGTLAHCDRTEDARQLYEAIAAIAQEPWKAEADKGLARLQSNGTKKRIAIVCGNGMDTFIRPIQVGLSNKFEFRLFTVASLRDVQQAMEWGDVCWFEWCDEILVRASTQLAKTCATVCRIHSYEVFESVITRVDWSFVDHLIFVSDHVRQIFEAQVDKDIVKSVVHNGIDMSKWTYSEHRPSTDIACLGFLNHKKNPAMILQILAKLVAKNPGYKLHVGGKIQELRYKIYFDHLAREMGIAKNIVHCGWIENVDEWLESKDYMLSTSVFESFGMSIMEAMAKGIKPVIHNWPGALGLYPEEIIFNSVDEAVEMITSSKMQSQVYRGFVQEHYTLDKQLDRIESLLTALAVDGPVARAA